MITAQRSLIRELPRCDSFGQHTAFPFQFVLLSALHLLPAFRLIVFQLAWLVDSIGADNQSGSLEFSTPPADPDSFVPIEVHFR